MPRAGPAVLRDRQTEVAAQGIGLVLGLEQTAGLENGKDLLAELGEIAGTGNDEIKAISGTALEPALNLVCHRLGRADKTLALRGEPIGGLAQSQFLFFHNAQDPLSVSFVAIEAETRHIRERLIQWIFAEIVIAERAAELDEELVEIEVFLAVANACECRLIGILDNRFDARHDENMVRVAAESGCAGFDVGVIFLRLFEITDTGEEPIAM